MNYGGNPRIESEASTVRPGAKHSLRDICLLFAVSLLLLANIARLTLSLTPQHAVALGTTPQAQPAPVVQTRTYAADAGANLAAEVDRAAMQCTGAEYRVPASLDLDARPLGLTTVVDAPTIYAVQADDANTLLQRILDCPFRKATGPYQGYTSYRLNWQYDTLYMSDETCKLTNVRIGLHVNQLLPRLSSQNPSLAARTATFVQNLTAHEQGHITIDTRYARQLSVALTNLSSMSCGSLQQQAKLTINTNLLQLNAANELYDTETDHGATQGAVL